MTAAPTPPPAGREFYLEQLRDCCGEQGTPEGGFCETWGCTSIVELLAMVDAAERRVAEAEELFERSDILLRQMQRSAEIKQAALELAARENETLLARLETERDEHREMFERQAKAVRILTARADEAERRVTEAEADALNYRERLHAVADQCAAAARDNERLSMMLGKLDAQTIVEALDMLGVALADHGHPWTQEQRFLYEAAVSIAATAAAPAARENERLRREIDRLRDALGWDADDPEDNYDLVSGDAALAAETREPEQ